MAAKDNLTKQADIQVTAREIDFVTRFARNWEHLREILGIMRPIRKEPGAVLKSKTASVVLESGEVGEGEEIPYSQAKVTETPYAEMTVEKYAKAVSIEAIKTYGYDTAVAMTDDEFLYQLQNEVTGRFYDYLNTGTLSVSETTWQRALAMAKGSVINKFKQMHRTATNVVGFVNVLDLYDYLGDANITVQTAFGFDYVQNFMGFSTIFLLSDEEIPRGRVIATPVENIVLYYVDPSMSDFARAGLSYTTDGDTNLIGFHTQGNYNTAVSECFAIMGMTLFAEYLDAIAVADIDTTPTLGTLTVSTAAGADATHTTIDSGSPSKEAPGNRSNKQLGTGAPTGTHGANGRTWRTWGGEPETEIECTSGQTLTLVEADSNYKALNSGSNTVTVGS